MTWNYRVVRGVWGGSTWYTIREVYYSPEGVVETMTKKGVDPRGETLDELKADLQYMLKSLEEPILEDTHDDIPTGN